MDISKQANRKWKRLHILVQASYAIQYTYIMSRATPLALYEYLISPHPQYITFMPSVVTLYPSQSAKVEPTLMNNQKFGQGLSDYRQTMVYRSFDKVTLDKGSLGWIRQLRQPAAISTKE